jgi:hypothetical protein
MDSAVLFDHDEFGAAPAIGAGKTHPVGGPQGLDRWGRRLQPKSVPAAGVPAPNRGTIPLRGWRGRGRLARGCGVGGRGSGAGQGGLPPWIGRRAARLDVVPLAKDIPSQPANQPARRPNDHFQNGSLSPDCIMKAAAKGPWGWGGLAKAPPPSHKFSPSNKNVPHWRVLLILQSRQPKRVGFRCPRFA